MKWKLEVKSWVLEYPLKNEKKNSHIVIKNPLYKINNKNAALLTCVYRAWVNTNFDKLSKLTNSTWQTAE